MKAQWALCLLSLTQVVFENVSFSYDTGDGTTPPDKRRLILDGVSFTIEPGQKVSCLWRRSRGTKMQADWPSNDTFMEGDPTRCDKIGCARHPSCVLGTNRNQVVVVLTGWLSTGGHCGWFWSRKKVRFVQNHKYTSRLFRV